MATFGENFISDDTKIAIKRGQLEWENRHSNKKFPEFASGARSVIYINEQRIAAALDVSYSVNIESTELRTIDAQLPWELIPGQISIEATLRRVVHPSNTVTQEHLFTIITAALHTPYAALKIQDKLGNTLFFAKGSFTSLQGQVAVGQTNIESVRFQGYYWRQNDSQSFYPDPAASGGSMLLRLSKAKLGAVMAIKQATVG